MLLFVNANAHAIVYFQKSLFVREKARRDVINTAGTWSGWNGLRARGFVTTAEVIGMSHQIHQSGKNIILIAPPYKIILNASFRF